MSGVEIVVAIIFVLILLVLSVRIVKGSIKILGNKTLLGIIVLIFLFPAFILWAIYESYEK
jgi:hypothetical protein